MRLPINNNNFYNGFDRHLEQFLTIFDTNRLVYYADNSFVEGGRNVNSNRSNTKRQKGHLENYFQRGKKRNAGHPFGIDRRVHIQA